MTGSKIAGLKVVLRSLAAGATFAASLAGGAAAQTAPTNEELGKRMDSLESKIDALIQMQVKAEERKTDDSNLGADKALSYRQGEPEDVSMNALQSGLTLDLFVLPLPDGEDIAESPQNSPSASEIVVGRSSYSWGDFVLSSSMKRFAEPMDDGRIGLQWSGFIQVPDTGEYAFQLELKANEGSNTSRCISSISIGKRSIISLRSDSKLQFRDYLGIPRQSIMQSKIALSAGLHEFSMWGHCLGPKPDFSKVIYNIYMKSPSDRALKPIDSTMFLTRM